MASRLTINTLSQEIEARIGVKPTLAKNLIKCIAEIAEKEVQSGYDFKLPGVATIRLAYRSKKGKRMVRNPQSGEMRMADPKPASIAVIARPDARMKRAAPALTSKGGKDIAAAYKERQDKAAAKRTAAEQ